MNQLVYCLCTNYNCDTGEVLAEPYSRCLSCGCNLEPVNELSTIGYIDDEEFMHGQDK